MQITADINTDDIVAEVMDSSEFDSHVNGLVDNLVPDALDEYLGRLDIDDINDFERRVIEIVEETVGSQVEDAIDQAMADAPDAQDADNRITDLESQVEALTKAVARMVDALSAAAILLGTVTKG